MTAPDTDDRLKQLLERVDHFPQLPGVYLMRDGAGKIIYVGKAKNLRSRVRSYFTGHDTRHQISYLLRRIENVDTILTDGEEQAFVLEADLIKRHKPRYNIRLKDDKAYLMIRVNRNAEWPRLELVRRVEDDGSVYFGPFPSGYQLRELLEVIKRVVPLRTCTDAILQNRARPCLEYEIKRCCGPCCLPVDRGQYMSWVQTAIGIVQGKAGAVLDDLRSQMDAAAEELRFEEAAAHRDRIAVLERFAEGQQLVAHRHGAQDVFALYREGRLGVLCVLSVMNGRIADSRTFKFDELTQETPEVLEQALQQYYDGSRPVPDEVLLPCALESEELLTSWLRRQTEENVEVIVPQRGSRVRLIKLAELNARQQFSERFESGERYGQISEELRRRFSLRQAPRRIECVDISNFQGSEVVGVVVAFFDGAPEKERYKKYRLQTQGSPDDFASIHEVVSRRLRRGMEEESLPDLLVIDGGQGQLASALTARNELGVSLDIISLAKMRLARQMIPRRRKGFPGKGSGDFDRKPERVFLEGAGESIALAGNDPVTHLLERIRDETHRFAITFHRARRSKQSVRSLLDRIPGIGPERKGRLLREFGSLKRLAGKSPEEVAKVGRMSLLLAKRVLEEVQKDQSAKGNGAEVVTEAGDRGPA